MYSNHKMLPSSLIATALLAFLTLAAGKLHTIHRGIDRHPDLDFVRDYSVVIPTRVVSGARFTWDLSTKKSRERTLEHHDSPSFTIPYKGKTFTLDLQLHRTLISGDYTEIYTGDDGSSKQEKVRPEACHYHGKVRGSSDSVVVMSTCDGLRGHFSEGTNMFHIQPHPEPETVAKSGYHAHAIYKDEDIKIDGPRRCGHNSTIINDHRSIMEHNFTEFKINANRRKKRATGTIPQYNKDKATRYVELFLVFDNNAWLLRPDRNRLRFRAIGHANNIDSLYKPLNVRVILTGVQIWNTGNPIKVTSDPTLTLAPFCRWRTNNLIGRVPHDIAQLNVGLDFVGNRVGMAFVGQVCDYSPCGINQDTMGKGVADIMAHEMGHNLGMLHNNAGTCGTCPWGGGCIMNSFLGSNPRVWTQCNVKDMNARPRHCLSNYPTTFYADASCGNGLVETGEECDCGSEAECPTVNPCCNPTGCKLKSSTECLSGECCDSCKFRAQGKVCRNADNECDIKDMCTGTSNVCPEDNYKPDGSDCSSNQGYCMAGECVNKDDQCKYRFGDLASDGDPGCYRYLNDKGNKNGHCGPISPGVYKKCASKDTRCGKLQCSHPSKKAVRPIIGHSGYGTMVTLNKGGGPYTCKAGVAWFGKDVIDFGLVVNGTKCGDGKMCYGFECKTLTSLAFYKTCPVVGGSTCAGNGECDQRGQCVCFGTYDPATNCQTTAGGSNPATVAPTTPRSGSSSTTGSSSATAAPTTPRSGSSSTTGSSSATDASTTPRSGSSSTTGSSSATAAPTTRVSGSTGGSSSATDPATTSEAGLNTTVSSTNDTTTAIGGPKKNVVDAATAVGGSVAVLVTVGVLAVACH